MLNLFFILLFAFYQTTDYRIDFGKHYDSQKHVKAQGYVETFTIKDAEGKQQFIISITKVAMPDVQNVPDLLSCRGSSPATLAYGQLLVK